MGKYRLTLSFEFEADDDPQARKLVTPLQNQVPKNMTAKLQAIYETKQPKPIIIDWGQDKK